MADSYVTDGRVGFAEPAPGVELYFCPPQSKTCEMLAEVLPKDQVDALNAINNGLIGVIVWRKPQITSTISPNSASHHKHNPKKQHSFSRRHPEKDANVNANVTAKPQNLPHAGAKPQSDEDDDDDVPPGFGPPATREEDDLPEFNFSRGSVSSGPQFSTHNLSRGQRMLPFQPHPQTPSRPVDQMRQLVQRYGQPITSGPSGNWQGNRGIGVAVQPWNDDDDDMPEWHPEENKTQIPQSLPVQVHGMQQSILRAHMAQSTAPYQQILQQTMPLQPPMNVMHGRQNSVPSWSTTPVSHNLANAAYQTNYGAPSGLESGQHGMSWRRDAPRSRGF